MDTSPVIAQTPERQQFLDDSIAQCMESARLCEKSARICYMLGNTALNPCIKLCRDCAEICFLDAKFMLRETPFHFRTSELCGEICDACAIACDQAVSTVQGSGMERDLLLACANACRRNSERCGQMTQRRLH
jgi:hypothetical protein